MITVVGVGFSITIVALVLASTQFGPRLLTLFTRDLTSQVTLGTFTGTFVYCVLVLRTVRGPDEGTPFVPSLAITGAIVLTLVSIAALVLFFNHVAVSIQAPKLVASVARDLDHAIDHLYPGRLGRGGPRAGRRPDPVDRARRRDPRRLEGLRPGRRRRRAPRGGAATRARRPAADPTGPVRDRRQPDLRRACGLGASTRTARRRDELQATIIVGDVRTAEDDIEFAVRQLVEVALRALSPAINDPFTAMAAVDWLGGALARLAELEFPSRFRYDESGNLRVIADVSTFAGIVHTIYSRIRHYGGDSPVVLNRLLEAVAAFGPHIRNESDRRQVRIEVEAVMDTGRARISSATDLEELDRRHVVAMSALGSEGHAARQLIGE